MLNQVVSKTLTRPEGIMPERALDFSNTVRPTKAVPGSVDPGSASQA